MTKQFTPTAHSTTVGGSAAGRIMACPASYELCRSMPEKGTTSYATEGTALHNAVEFCLIEGLVPGPDTASLVHEMFTDVELTAEHVTDCIDPALAQFDALYADLEETDGEVTVYKLEQQVQFPSIADSFGTLDVIIVTPARVVILDWKFGGGVPVSAIENKQMMYYARAAAHSMPGVFWGDHDGKDPDHPVDLVIIQPRVNPETPSIWRTTYGDLLEYEADLLEAYDEATGGSPKYARGEHCRFCSAKAICPQYKDVGQKLAKLAAGSSAGALEGVDPKAVVKDKIEAMLSIPYTPEDVAHWLFEADICMAWAKAVGELAMREAKAGRPPAGKKLVATLANTTYVSDDDYAIDRMLARLKLSIEERRKPWKPISPTQATKLLKAKGLKPLLKSNIHRPPGNVKLVDESDKRPAIAPPSERAQIVGEKLKEMQAEA